MSARQGLHLLPKRVFHWTDVLPAQEPNKCCTWEAYLLFISAVTGRLRKQAVPRRLRQLKASGQADSRAVACKQHSVTL